MPPRRRWRTWESVRCDAAKMMIGAIDPIGPLFRRLPLLAFGRAYLDVGRSKEAAGGAVPGRVAGVRARGAGVDPADTALTKIVNASPRSRNCRIDSTDIKAWSNGGKRNKRGKHSDTDAGWIVKAATNGRMKSRFGFKVHILADTEYEMPIAITLAFLCSCYTSRHDCRCDWPGCISWRLGRGSRPEPTLEALAPAILPARCAVGG